MVESSSADDCDWRCRRPMKDPRYDKKVSWLEFNLSETRFLRCAAGMEAVRDTRCDIDCRLMLMDSGLEIDNGRDEVDVEEYVFDIRLCDCDKRFICSSDRWEDKWLPELRLELLRDAASYAGSCCDPSNDVDSAGGVGGL